MLAANTIKSEDFSAAFIHATHLKPQFLDTGYEYLLPFKAKPSPGSNTLVVVFHGAVNRQKRSYPSFAPYIRGVEQHAHQLAFADPTLLLSEELTISWYAGSYKLPLQNIIVSLVEDLVKDLGITRLVFVGGSGGGFAALYYSWHFPRSIAVAFSPQTVVENYGETLRKRYIDLAWPNGYQDSENPPTLDLRLLYSTSVKNTVIYLQSSGDYVHLHDQMIPFLTSVSRESHDRFVSHVSYWGKPGHSGSVPLSEVGRWARAAISLTEPSAHNIRDVMYESTLDAKNALNDSAGSKIIPQRNTSSQRIFLAKQNLADRLAEELLQKERP